MGNDYIECFNEKECTYTACKQFNNQLDTCNFMIIGLLGGAVKQAEKKPIKDEPQRKPETKSDAINSLKVGDASSKEHKITVQGKLVYDASQRDVNTKSGPLSVTDIVISDGTGQLKISAWGDKGDPLMDFIKDDEVLVENIYRIKEIYGGVLQADAGKFFKISKL